MATRCNLLVSQSGSGSTPVLPDTSEKPDNGQKGVFMSKRRQDSVEFKQGAVEQTHQPGVSCAQVARELGIGANLLRRWRREAGLGSIAPMRKSLFSGAAP